MKKKAIELWPELIEHINKSWQKKKGRKYPWTGQDFKLLQILTRSFTVPELAALYSVYLMNSPFWGLKTGWLVSGFFQERGVLIDDPSFKTLVRKYEIELGMKEPKQVAMELGLK